MSTDFARTTDTPPTAPPIDAPVPVVPTAASWPWWVLRIWVCVQALATFLQPVWAGRFLAGDYGALNAHRVGAELVLFLCLTQILTSLLAWRPGRASAGLILTTVLLTVAVYIQLHSGFARNLGLHIPLGVFVIVVTAGLLVWVWRHGPSRTVRNRA